jgi:hypothetical protein
VPFLVAFGPPPFGFGLGEIESASYDENCAVSLEALILDHGKLVLAPPFSHFLALLFLPFPIEFELFLADGWRIVGIGFCLGNAIGASARIESEDLNVARRWRGCPRVYHCIWLKLVI